MAVCMVVCPAVRRLRRVERLLGACAVVWLQVVGVVTHSVVHHILHALPLVVLVLAPRSPWVHHTAALAGFAWVFMLGAMTPMLYLALIEGMLFQGEGPAFRWLAPGMVLISAAWSASNIALLRRRAAAWLPACVVLLGVAVALASVQPWLGRLCAAPVEHVLAGRWEWVVPLALEALLITTVAWWLVRRLTASPAPPLTARSLTWQVAYWAGFVACMLAGLHPAVN